MVLPDFFLAAIRVSFFLFISPSPLFFITTCTFVLAVRLYYHAHSCLSTTLGLRR
nr:MAG TPA: hypothetical protein [Caudoviricetes sp.]